MLNPSTRHGASAESGPSPGSEPPADRPRRCRRRLRRHVLNTYTGWQRITGTEPARPWAVYLAGRDGLFRLLCFDLDAKTPDAAAAAARDADVLAGFLVDVGLQPVVCDSGPSGGRHVWAALAEGVDERAAAELARFAKHVCPTLDTSQLTTRSPDVYGRQGRRTGLVVTPPSSAASCARSRTHGHRGAGSRPHAAPRTPRRRRRARPYD